jgi:hypothetical protein
MVSFSSINDAYTTSMDTTSTNKYKQPDVFSQISQISPISNIKPFEVNYEPFKNVETTENDYEYFKQSQSNTKDYQESEDITCDDIINHVNECDYCRSKLAVNDPYHIPEYLQNTVLYIIMSIFILFLLDIFVRIGKLLK